MSGSLRMGGSRRNQRMRDGNIRSMVFSRRSALKHQNSSHSYKVFTKSQLNTFSTSKSIQRPHISSHTLLQTFPGGYIPLNTSPYTPRKLSVLLKPERCSQKPAPRPPPPIVSKPPQHKSSNKQTASACSSHTKQWPRDPASKNGYHMFLNRHASL